MATTTNYGWTTPDDSALVKDGAAAIRTLGTSVDTTTKNLNPSTTLGDIEYRSSTSNTNTRLGIGSTGQVLTVSGGVPTWGSVSSGSTLNQVATGTLSGTSVSITGLSSYDNILIVINGSTWGTGNSRLAFTINSDTNSYYNWSGWSVGNGTSGRVSSLASPQASFRGQQYDQDNTGSTNNTALKFTSCKAVGYTDIDYDYIYPSGGNPYGTSGKGWYAAAAAVSSIQITNQAGYTFNGGTYYVIAG